GRVTSVELHDGSLVTGDEFVLSVPHWICRSLLPADFPCRLPAAAGERERDSGQSVDPHTGSVGLSLQGSLGHLISQIETAPIASAHLWFDQPLTDLPHAVLLDRTSQWFFNHSHRTVTQDDHARQPSVLPAARFYCQVVISAADHLSSCSESDILNTVETELKAIWPQSRQSTRLHGRVLTEHRAVFAPLPGVNAFRPVQQSAVQNLQLAGDWTQTGWPSTMEGAVRSGFLAARNILVRRGGRLELPSPLPSSLLFRLLFS
ncbi:MAG: FAD-dependent oxidoreductase, partial [Planctomycetaceae bacterium]